MTEDQDFQMILSKEDYHKYIQQKLKFKQFEKLFAELTQTNGQLQIENTLLKKSFYSKKQQIKYLAEIINKFIDRCNKNQPLVQMVDIQQSIYENLVQNNTNGLSSIQAFDINQQFRTTYQKISFQLERISEIASYTGLSSSRLKQLKKPNKSNDSDIVQQLKPVQVELQQQKLIVSRILQQKLKLQKQLQFFKLKDKQNKHKIQQYEYKTNKNKNNKQEKSYFIKLLIDEYYRDLEVKLRNMQLQRQDIQTIVASQMNGIKQYIETTVSKLSISKGANKFGNKLKK